MLRRWNLLERNCVRKRPISHVRLRPHVMVHRVMWPATMKAAFLDYKIKVMTRLWRISNRHTARPLQRWALFWKAWGGRSFCSGPAWRSTGDDPHPRPTLAEDGATGQRVRVGTRYRAGCYSGARRPRHRGAAAVGGRDDHHAPAALRQAADTGS